jgi:ferredoxin-thioredoxin reductase catalytic subunit
VGKKKAGNVDKGKANAMRRQVLDFARDNKLIIHPGRGFDYYVDNYFECGQHCPCDPKRLSCPCPESIHEVEKNGWCKCRLFWRDYDTYKESHVKER